MTVTSEETKVGQVLENLPCGHLLRVGLMPVPKTTIGYELMQWLREVLLSNGVNIIDVAL